MDYTLPCSKIEERNRLAHSTRSSFPFLCCYHETPQLLVSYFCVPFSSTNRFNETVLTYCEPGCWSFANINCLKLWSNCTMRRQRQRYPFSQYDNLIFYLFHCNKDKIQYAGLYVFSLVVVVVHHHSIYLVFQKDQQLPYPGHVIVSAATQCLSHQYPSSYQII